MYILYDIGGTKMRLAVSNDLEKFNDSKILDTPSDFDEGIAQFVEMARELAGDEKILAVAGGVPGSFDKDKSKILSSPNMGGWVNRPFKEMLEKGVGAPVYIENDADIVGLGEAVYGAGMGSSIVMYITVSTGVGGVRIVDQKFDASAFGFEPGHQYISFSQVPSKYVGDGKCEGHNTVGHLEGYISGTALQRRYNRKPYEITDPEAWEEGAKLLAYGLHNTIRHWSPDVVVVGGSMIVGDPAISLDRTRMHLEKIYKKSSMIPPLKKAELKDVGGLYGAMAYLATYKQ